MSNPLRRLSLLGTAILLVPVAAGCGADGGKKAAPTPQPSAGVSLADPEDGIVLTAPEGTEHITDPTEMADLLTGVANSGPVDPRLKVLAKKLNPHSYYPSSIELWVQPLETTPADVAGQAPAVSAELAKNGATGITTRVITAGGQPAVRADYRFKGSEGQLSDGTQLFLWHKGKLYVISVVTNDSAPEHDLADGVLASVRFSA